jgi:hypothetical protein
MSLSLSAGMREGAGSRSPAARGEAAGPGVSAETTDAPGTVLAADTTAAPGTTLVPAIGSSMAPETGLGVSTRSGGLGATFRVSGGLGESMRSGLAGSSLAPETGLGVSTRSGGLGEAFRTGGLGESLAGSSLAPETGLGVSTRSGGLGEAFRTGGIGEYLRSGLAQGAGLGESFRSGLGPGSGRGESILPALGRWAKHITTPTGQGDGGLTASFRERARLKATGLSDVMSTPRNLEYVLQQKGQVYMTKEGEEGNSARTTGGGEWAGVVGGVHGTNRGGVEWLVTGADVGTISGGKISGGTRFCTKHVDLCTVKTHLISKADLKSEWLYTKTTDTRSRRKTASMAWGVSKYAFGGRGEELSFTMMSTVQFKRFSEILLVQVDGGSNALDMDWAPIVATVMRPSEYGTPHKVKFQPEPVLDSLEDLGWNDVVPRGATNSDKDSDPAFDDSLRMNQLAINLKLTRMNVETLERRLPKGLVSYEDALESLGSQVHATRVQVGRDSGIYTSGEESVWEGIAGAHVKMDSMESRIRSEILSEIVPIVGRIKSDTDAGTSALVNREVALATRQLSSSSSRFAMITMLPSKASNRI